MRRVRNLAVVGLLAAPLGVAIYTGYLHHEERRVALPLGIALGPRPPVYADDDPWRAYLAPESACPGGEEGTRRAYEQEETMICLVNWARARRGLAALRVEPRLRQAAITKVLALERCGELRHDACGDPPDTAVREARYPAEAWGENLYFGSVELGAPKVALDRWLNSPEHNANVFGEWTDIGVALVRASRAAPQEDSSLWVAQFGRR
jgi:uncharacterized protein YkwD